MSDLASSLYGARFNEQRLRMSKSANVERRIYLVEGVGSTRDTFAASLPTTNPATNSGMYPIVGSVNPERLRHAVMDTMVQMGFSIVRTRNMDDTIECLRRLHASIVEKCWPGSPPQQKYTALPLITTKSWVSYPELEDRVKHDRVVGTKSVKVRKRIT